MTQDVAACVRRKLRHPLRPVHLEEHVRTLVNSHYHECNFRKKHSGIVEVVLQGDRLMIAPIYLWERRHAYSREDDHAQAFGYMLKHRTFWFRFARPHQKLELCDLQELRELTTGGLAGTEARVRYVYLSESEVQGLRRFAGGA